ncbi:MAG: hypothetical protein ABI867_21945 [Kofleriaceae bacterium]
MKRLLVLLAACQTESTSVPAPAVVEPARPITTTLVGCAPAGLGPATATTAWTPYAKRDRLAPATATEPAAAAVKAQLAARLVDIDLCLTDKVGSVVALIDLDKKIEDVRVGGIGHRPTELCIMRVIKSIRAEALEPVEIECGFGAGVGGPLRVTADGGYTVVEVAHGKRPEIAPDKSAEGRTRSSAEGDAKSIDTTILAVVDRDVTGTELRDVLAPLTGGVLVAVRADGGPPVFVAMVSRAAPAPLELRVTADSLVPCGGEPAPVLQPKALDAAMQKALAACKDCGDTIPVAIDGDHTAKELIAAVSAVRRTGHDPVLVARPACK